MNMDLQNTQADSAHQWISLMDYAMKHEVSLSTLRRYIKAKKIAYRVVNGRYLLLDSGVPAVSVDPAVQKLRSDLQRAQEEIAELKTLIAFYEERLPQPRLDV